MREIRLWNCRITWTALAALVAVGLVLVGCDGGAKSPTAPPTPKAAAPGGDGLASAPAESGAPTPGAPGRGVPTEPGDGALASPPPAAGELASPPTGDGTVASAPAGDGALAPAAAASPAPTSPGVALPGSFMAATKGGVSKGDLCHWDREAMAFVQIRVGQPGFDNHLAQHPMDKPLPTWWLDADGDDFGDAAFPLEACDQPAGYVDNDDDCDDAASSCTTVCGGDADGDGRVDCLDRCSDADTDGYGDNESGTVVGAGSIPVGACTTDGSTPCDVGPACLGGDCDDAATSCTTDCSDGDGDGTAECLDQCIDADGDGYGSDNAGSVVGAGSVAVEDCTTDGSTPCTLTDPCLGEDCDDGDAGINPAADDDDCDDVDDNCSGTPDDEYVPTPTSCGVGVCESSGQLICQTGSVTDSCAPGTPTETPEMTCDDTLDNDCDGLTDDADTDDCGNQPPVAVDDNFVGGTDPACILPSCGGDRQCTLNAPAGTITGNDFDPDGDPFTSGIAGVNIPGRTCNGDFLCTTDAGFNSGASSLTVNGDGSFSLTYRTTQNFVIGGPADVVIAEFVYVDQDNQGATSNEATVMVPVYTDQSCN